MRFSRDIPQNSNNFRFYREFLTDSFQRPFAARVDDQSPAILRKLTGKRQTQSTGSTGNKRILHVLPLRVYIALSGASDNEHRRSACHKVHSLTQWRYQEYLDLSILLTQNSRQGLPPESSDVKSKID